MKLDDAMILRLASGSFVERRTLFVPMRKIVNDGRRWGLLEGVLLGSTLCMATATVAGLIGVLANGLDSWAWVWTPLVCCLVGFFLTGLCSSQVEKYLYGEAGSWDESELETQSASADASEPSGKMAE